LEEDDISVINNNKWPALWFYGASTVCLLLVVATVNGIGLFSLRNESNPAALWSGMLLLLIAIHAFDGRSQHQSDNPSVGRAWLVISMILVSLSFDEIGSLHERLPSDTHLQYWLWVSPFALVYACASAYALLVLYRSEEFRWSAKLIFLGFLLFASVALQEEIEWRLDLPEHLKPIRGGIEEGSELLGMILLLKASMINTRGLLSRTGESAFPAMEAVESWRTPVLALGLIGGPLVSIFTVNLDLESQTHGIPADWPATAVFFLAAFAATRPFLKGERQLDRSSLILAGICFIGCASTMLDIGSTLAQVLMGVLSALACLIWILDSRFLLRTYLPATVFLASVLVISWVFSDSEFVRYTSIQYVALSFYYVCSGRRRR